MTSTAAPTAAAATLAATLETRTDAQLHNLITAYAEYVHVNESAAWLTDQATAQLEIRDAR